MHHLCPVVRLLWSPMSMSYLLPRAFDVQRNTTSSGGDSASPLFRLREVSIEVLYEFDWNIHCSQEKAFGTQKPFKNYFLNQPSVDHVLVLSFYIYSHTNTEPCYVCSTETKKRQRQLHFHSKNVNSLFFFWWNHWDKGTKRAFVFCLQIQPYITYSCTLKAYSS